MAYYLGVFQTRIDEIAERAGLSAYDRLGLETMLGALPWPERRRVGLLLKGAKAQSDNAALHQAANMLLSLASEIWSEAPNPEHDGKNVQPFEAGRPTRERRPNSD